MMWRDPAECEGAMVVLRDLRKTYAKELMCDPTVTADMIRESIYAGQRVIRVSEELSAFWMLMLDRGAQIAVCAPGNGSLCLHNALQYVREQSAITAVHAFVRGDNCRAIQLFCREMRLVTAEWSVRWDVSLLVFCKYVVQGGR